MTTGLYGCGVFGRARQVSYYVVGGPGHRVTGIDRQRAQSAAVIEPCLTCAWWASFVIGHVYPVSVSGQGWGIVASTLGFPGRSPHIRSGTTKVAACRFRQVAIRCITSTKGATSGFGGQCRSLPRVTGELVG